MPTKKTKAKLKTKKGKSKSSKSNLKKKSTVKSKAGKKPKANLKVKKQSAKKVVKEKVEVPKKSKTITGGKIDKGMIEKKVQLLIQKGRQRGFVTYSELLKEFPNIENDIIFLEDLYAQFEEAGIDILEEGGLLDSVDEEVFAKMKTGRSSEAAMDSVQMYLKEIGRHKLINAQEEKELAKRIL